MLKQLTNKKGYTHISAVIGFLILMISLALFMTFTPVFMAKSTLDMYANELIREAEIEGEVGSGTTARLARLNSLKGLNPTVRWSRSGKVDIGDEIVVTVTKPITVNFFGTITFNLQSTASGRSEVFWK